MGHNVLRRRWILLVPAVVAIAAFANSVPGDFVFDDVVLIERGTALERFDLGRIFLSNYWGPERADRNYRPVVLLSYALNHRLGQGAASFHVVNVALNAALAFVIALFLREVFEDDALAALGASLFAVLSVHVEAVANIVGRAEILSALGIFGAATVALRSSPPLRAIPGSKPERWGPALAVGALTLLGIGAKEHAAMTPVLLCLAPLALRRRIPWKSFLASGGAVVLYLGLRAAAIGSRTSVVVFFDNPLHSEGSLTRALNGLRLLGLHAWKIIFPAHLSADYSYDQIPVLHLGDSILWLAALGVLALIALGTLLGRRRFPLVALAAAWFAVAFAPTANVLFPIGTLFGERLSFTPSFAYPLFLCAVVAALPGSRPRRIGLVAMGCLVLAYGTRTWIRNGDWATAETMYLRMSVDAPRSTRSHQKTAEAYRSLAERAPSGAERSALLQKAKASVARALEIYPRNGVAQATLGELLLLEGKHAEAEAQLTKAMEILIEEHSFQPVVYLLRGQCRLHLGRHAEAVEDADRYLRARAKLGGQRSFQAFQLRGLALALQGKFEAGIADFSTAIAEGGDLPETRNNRALCKLQLKDYEGAIEDWKAALRLAESPERGALPLLRDEESSPPRVRAKIAEAYEALAASRRAEGEEGAARAAEAEAARYR